MLIRSVSVCLLHFKMNVSCTLDHKQNSVTLRNMSILKSEEMREDFEEKKT